jgi:hypothetical protein
MIDNVEIDDAALDAAAERGAEELKTKPRAVSARYDRQADRIAIELANGCTFLFPPVMAQDLQDATPDQLADVTVSPAGLALHWPQIDVDFSVAGLVAGIFGTAQFMEARRRGGQSRSAAKAAAARENGKKGGRPRSSA